MKVIELDGGTAFEVLEREDGKLRPTGRIYRLTDNADGNAADGFLCWDLQYGERALKVRVHGECDVRIIDIDQD